MMKQRMDYSFVIDDCKKKMQQLMDEISMSPRGAIEWLVENYTAGMTENSVEKLMLGVHIAALCVRDGEMKYAFKEKINKVIEEYSMEKLKPAFEKEEYELLSADMEEVKSKIETVKIV